MRVLVLGGGPDAERPVSLASAGAVSAALAEAGYEVNAQTIDRPTAAEVSAMPGDVVFPALHGSFGEGGPMQDILEADGRPYVGAGPLASRLAMDKLATKAVAHRLGIPTPDATIFDIRDGVCPFPWPVVLKPVHDGSSVGVHLCFNQQQWTIARQRVVEDIRARPGRVYMIERACVGRELTVGLLDGGALPLIEITAAEGFYDYDAKYERDDTSYTIEPEVPAAVAKSVADWAQRLAGELGVRHLGRVDFMLDGDGRPWLLEINTIPGFTGHSLVPMAAARVGLDMPALCARLVELALRDGRSSSVKQPAAKHG
jgi:D-alanine-D-alanine ligase